MRVANKVTIIRRAPRDGTPVVVLTSISDAKKMGAANIVLAPGDVVTIEQTPLTVIADAVFSFVRIGLYAAPALTLP